MDKLGGAERPGIEAHFVLSTSRESLTELASQTIQNAVKSRNFQMREEIFTLFGSEFVFRQAALVLHEVK